MRSDGPHAGARPDDLVERKRREHTDDDDDDGRDHHSTHHPVVTRAVLLSDPPNKPRGHLRSLRPSASHIHAVAAADAEATATMRAASDPGLPPSAVVTAPGVPTQFIAPLSPEIHVVSRQVTQALFTFFSQLCATDGTPPIAIVQKTDHVANP